MPAMEYHLTVKRSKIVMPVQYYAKWKKPVSEYCVLFDSIYMKCSIGKSIMAENRLMLPGAGEGEDLCGTRRKWGDC